MLKYFAFFFGILSANATDYRSPRTLALGGAGHAAPLLTDSIFMNPSYSSFLPVYSYHMSYDGYSGPEGTEPKGRLYNASILDGRSEVFQAGLSYTRKADGQLIHVGASKAILKSFGLGLGTKFGYSRPGRGTLNEYTLSTSLAPLDWAQGSLTIDNLMGSAGAKRWGLYREFTLGTKFNVMKLLMFYIDPHTFSGKPGKTSGYEAGIELPLLEDLFIRVGKNRNSFQPQIQQYGDGWGFGFGWVAPRLSLDFAIGHTNTPVQAKDLAGSATIFF